MFAEFNNSLGFGGTVPLGITYKSEIDVFFMKSAQSNTSDEASKLDRPLLLETPNILCALPSLRSQSTINVVSPV